LPSPSVAPVIKTVPRLLAPLVILPSEQRKHYATPVLQMARASEKKT
jgi:hypothetical protein